MVASLDWSLQCVRWVCECVGGEDGRVRVGLWSEYGGVHVIANVSSDDGAACGGNHVPELSLGEVERVIEPYNRVQLLGEGLEVLLGVRSR